MTFDVYTIVITGLGGQGLISMLQILGNALVTEGYKVITSETHGLSQRGGKVTGFLRFGNKLNAPIPMIGTADMIITLEESCVLDVLNYANLNKSTKLIISSYEKKNISNVYPSLEYLLNALFENSKYIYIIPANEIALKYGGNLKIMNSVLLGYILKFLPLDRKNLEGTMAQNFLGKMLEKNLKALNEGLRLE